MRKYQTIWDTVKDTYFKSGKGICQITANPALHARIKKAVIKEKYNDKGFALQIAEEDKRLVLQTEISGRVMTFTLKACISLDSLK